MSKDATSDNPCFHIVGIGASAGGLAPLESFFEHMPNDTGMAFVVVQHLSPDFKSQMEQLLGRKTSMPIHRVTNGMVVKQNAIYLIPPKKLMAISSGKLLLADKDTSDGLSLPIDEFFRSLAADIGRQAIGIILSGTGADGSRGVVDIAEHGGLVLTQNEETASFDGMPLSALATGVVSVSIPPENMPDLILRYVNEALTPDLLAEQDINTSDSFFNAVFKILKAHFSIDFSMYKLSTVSRRIKRRLLLRNQDSLEQYVGLLESDIEEREHLYKDLLIGVTRFFRDREVYKALDEEVIPKLVNDTSPGETIRAWVAACATGEEAYSMAILFLEHIERSKKSISLKIFATDIHKTSIKKASHGVYPEELIANISQARKDRFFTKRNDGFSVNEVLRKSVSFATHNLITDAPFTRLDFISCRNLLIYLQPNIQKKILSLFHFSLKKDSLLILGNSETLGDLSDEFDEIHNRLRIYKKRRDVRLPTIGRFELQQSSVLPNKNNSLSFGSEISKSSEANLLPIYDMLLEQFMPPAFLLDEKLYIVHIFGGGEKFLAFRSGRASNYFLDLIPENVRAAFSSALSHSSQKDKAVNYTGVSISDTSGKDYSVQLSVKPLDEKEQRSRFFLLKLTETEEKSADSDEELVRLDSVTQEHIKSLEGELRYTQENLQATIEELETANEEMQASNEELVASNEELQSTNEELQSVNEELYTVNHEHQRKIDELTQANDDMDNLLATTRVGVIFLDKDLCIRRYTPEIGRLFHLLPQDIGRSIEGFTHSLNYPELVEKLHEVIATEIEFEVDTTDQKNNPFILRILPYRATNTGEPQGLLITLIDIRSLKKAQDELFQFKTISDLTSDFHLIINADHKIQYANRALCHELKYSTSELSSMKFIDLVTNDEIDRVKPLLTHFQENDNSRIVTQFTGKDHRLVDVEVIPTDVSVTKNKPLIFISARDVTERTKIQEQLTLRTHALESTDNGIIITDASNDNKTVYINSGFTQVTGYRSDEIVGQNCRFLQGEKTDPETIQDISKALSNDQSIEVQIINYKKDGTEFWNNLHISPVKDDHGKTVNYVGVLVDISEHRAAEEKAKEDARKIKLLLDSTEEGIYFINQHGVCTFCNRSAASLLGYESPDELVGSMIHDKIYKTKNKSGKNLILQSIADGQPYSTDKDYFNCKNGDLLPVEYWSHPIHEENDLVDGSVITFIDITQRKKQEKQLKVMQKSAEKANKAKTMFLANVSHELRTPLTAIIGFTEIVKNTSTDDEVLDKVSRIKRNSLHLKDLLNDLLDLSKIESGFLTIEPEECDLQDLLIDVQSMSVPRARRKGLSLTFTVGEDVPKIIHMDPTRFRQIVSNLLSNAIKFTQKGHITVNVDKKVIDGQSQLTVAVTDTGIGIKKEHRDNLFKPFYRPEGQTATGSGLGLNISQRLVHQLGGHIEFDSTPGVGSQFRFSLPLEVNDSTLFITPGTLAEKDLKEQDTPLPSLDCQVLVVDDHDDIRSFIADLLESCGAATASVNTGQAAIDYLTQHRNTEQMPDIVLMDINMPGISGQEATQIIREHGFTLPIIAITAGAMKGEREKCILAGCNDYLSKPINNRVLINKIHRLISSKPADQTFNYHYRKVDSQKILLIDDSIDLVIAFKELLMSKGYIVEASFSGYDGIDVSETFVPDIILLDISLPDLDGREVIAKLRENTALDDTKVIAMTGHSDKDTKKSVMSAGFDDYLIKPVTLKRIVDTIESLYNDDFVSADD